MIKKKIKEKMIENMIMKKMKKINIKIMKKMKED